MNADHKEHFKQMIDRYGIVPSGCTHIDFSSKSVDSSLFLRIIDGAEYYWCERWKSFMPTRFKEDLSKYYYEI